MADLLGGFKPVDAGLVCIPLYQEFVILFTNTFPSKVSFSRKYCASFSSLLNDES